MGIGDEPTLPSDDMHRIIDDRVAPERRERVWATSECCAACKPDLGEACAHVGCGSWNECRCAPDIGHLGNLEVESRRHIVRCDGSDKMLRTTK